MLSYKWIERSRPGIEDKRQLVALTILYIIGLLECVEKWVTLYAVIRGLGL